MARAKSTYRGIAVTRKVRRRTGRNGKIDGRLGHPDVRRDGGTQAVTTPYLTDLTRSAEETVEDQRGIAIRDTAADREEMNRITRRLEVINHRRSELQQKLDDAPPADLERRGAGEARLPDEIVTRRRSDEWDRSMAPTRAEIASLESERTSLEEQLAVVDARIAAVVRAAQSDAERYLHYMDRVKAQYLRSLIRHHADGGLLADLSRPAPSDLTWVTAADHIEVLNNKLADGAASEPITRGAPE